MRTTSRLILGAVALAAVIGLVGCTSSAKTHVAAIQAVTTVPTTLAPVTTTTVVTPEQVGYALAARVEAAIAVEVPSGGWNVDGTNTVDQHYFWATKTGGTASSIEINIYHNIEIANQAFAVSVASHNSIRSVQAGTVLIQVSNFAPTAVIAAVDKVLNDQHIGA